MIIDRKNVEDTFKKYTDNYDTSDEKIKLKVDHTYRVAALSERIAISLGLDKADTDLAWLIGMLHDIGRFEQVRKYNTFIDKISINHGEYGVKILFEDNLIEKFNVDEKYYKIIKTAILNHNRSKIEENLTVQELLHSKIIRDADKLDCFYVLLTDDIKNTYGCSAEDMQNETFSNEIIREFKEDHMIDYKKRATYGDIWISHMAYVFDFYYKSSYIVIKEKDYLNKLTQKMNFKNPQTIQMAQEILQIANDYIKSKI